MYSLNSFQNEKTKDSRRKKSTVMTFVDNLDKIMSEDIVSIPLGIFRDNVDTTYVPKNELMQFCNLKELDIISVIAYIR